MHKKQSISSHHRTHIFKTQTRARSLFNQVVVRTEERNTTPAVRFVFYY